MQPKNLSTLGGSLRQTFPDGAFLSFIPMPAFNSNVAPGSSNNHGNYRDPNSWSYTVLEVKTWKGYVRVDNNGQPDEQWWGQIDGNYTGFQRPAWDTVMLQNQALSKLYDKIRGNLDLAIDIAESRQSTAMVRNLTKVIDFARGGAWKQTGNLANGWLQYQYGWKPLIKDVFDVCDESSRTVRRALTHVKARSTATLDGVAKVTQFIASASTNVTRTSKGKQSCTYQVQLEPRGFDPGQWSSLNPVSLAWELIPYSFVVDWFIDVGSYMRNLESALLYKQYFQKGFVSNLYAVDCTYDCGQKYLYGPDGASPPRFTRIEWAQAKVRDRRFSRSVLSSMPLPHLPMFSAKLGSERLLSAASLLRQIFDREHARYLRSSNPVRRFRR